MILCIDSGNSRIKWGMHDGSRWLAQAALAQEDDAGLSALPDAWPEPQRVMLANVAGPAAGERIRHQLARWGSRFCEVRPQAAGGGVTNLYDDPSRLGVDRWCALVGARSLTPDACLVVMAGTAVTIDSLDADGRFLGGMILPGVDLMRRALASETAGLPLADGRHVACPRRTDDAIATGIVEALAGAVERAYLRLGGADKSCLLSGGNAGLLAPALVIPVRRAENLPLEGLRALAVAA